MDEVSTEEWTTKWSWVAFLNGSWTDADQMVKGFYNWTAPNITRCTYTIAKMEESPVAQSVKDLYIAEVRALRAFFHVRFISALWSYANDSGSRPGNQSGPGL